MKIKLIVIAIILCCVLITLSNIPDNKAGNSSRIQNKSNQINGEENEPGADDIQQKFFADWHEPYGAALEPEMLNQIWKEIGDVPAEKEMAPVNEKWTSIGPHGSVLPNNRKYSGRVLDMKFDNSGHLMIGTSTGGLWTATDSTPVPLCDKITSLAVSTFDVQPGNQDMIILGTGELAYGKTGTGIWRTTDRGLTWTNISLDIPSKYTNKIRFSPGKPDVVHAVNENGYYRSEDAGITWNKHLTGAATDVAVNPRNPNIVYCGIQNHDDNSGGIYKSTNGGTTWNKLTRNNLPALNVGVTKISICESDPDFIYAIILKADNFSDLLGIYSSQDEGDFWGKSSPATNIIGGSSSGTIAVNPKKPNLVLAGGLWLWKSTNYGKTWNMFSDNEIDIHADLHFIRWSDDGRTVCIGHDGGTSLSNDSGKTFSSAKNIWPISQFVGFDVAKNNPNFIFGGTQDNAIMGTTNGGANWRNPFIGGADGGEIAFDPFNSSLIYAVQGAYGGGLLFRRFRSTDSGISWEDISNGIGHSDEFNPKIRTDNSKPIYQFTNSADFLYFSVNKGESWEKRNPNAFPADIANFQVREYGNKLRPFTYVALLSFTQGQRLKLQAGTGEFQERSNGIADRVRIRNIAMHPSDSNVAYALVNGLVEGQKVYKTTNQGLLWTNISGNLPNVPVADLIPHPSYPNILYLGTEMGCFKTTDGGATWFRWNDGMPEAAIVSEMRTHTSNDGKFFIIVSTYGRSFWDRRAEDLTPGTNGVLSVITSQQIPNKFELHQNYPNPFNPSTKIRFDIPKQSQAKITVYDVTGREVAVLVNEIVQAGSHEIEFNAGSLSSGAYFYKFDSGVFSDIKKMVLIK